MLKSLSSVAAFALLSGCASYGVVDNTPLSGSEAGQSYSLQQWQETKDFGEITLLLAFSGGGTRAAALAYGVLEELRDTEFTIDDRSIRMLDEVDRITSVSGGSFAAAYYGLYGEQMFDRFEDEFLRQDIQGALERKAFNPINWFRRTGRTERAIELYEETLFHNATYADMIQPGRPMIIINASDLGHGVRFSFIQEYFNILCSDLTSFPVARAVTASSAVPIVFNPVVVENYEGCGSEAPDWLVAISEKGHTDPDLAELSRGLSTYYDRDRRKYIHFVDGGITDNLGLRAIFDIVELGGGAEAFVEKFDGKPPKHYVILAVDASTDAVSEMDESPKQPSIFSTIGAVTDAQLHRYNAATTELVEYAAAQWTKALSTPEAPISSYFVSLTFRSIPDKSQREYFNTVPTSFRLTEEQVDRLKEAGRQLLRDNPDYQRLLAELRSD
jgi:NTE family protein